MKVDADIDNVLKIKMKTVHDIKDDLSNLDTVLNQYRALYKVHTKILDVRGKYIKDALNEQALGFGYFDEARINLKSFVLMIEHYIKYQRSLEYKKIRKTESKAAGEREINILIDSSPTVMNYLKIYREINEIYEKFVSVSESFKQRGYSLNNRTKLIEHDMEKVIL